jgi:hypothetical protein
MGSSEGLDLTKEPNSIMTAYKEPSARISNQEKAEVANNDSIGPWANSST